MAFRVPNQLRIGRAVGQSVRLFLAGLTTVLVLACTLNIGNGGFLLSKQRLLWIQAQPINGGWTFELAGAGPMEAEPPSAPPHAWTIGLRESSMGRSNGATRQWRHNSWTVLQARNPAGEWVDWGTDAVFQSEPFAIPLDRFVRTSIIPGSDAMAIWPTTPCQPIQHEGGPWRHWSVWQDQGHPWVFAALAAFSLGAGLCVALLLSPVVPDHPPSKTG